MQEMAPTENSPDIFPHPSYRIRFEKTKQPMHFAIHIKQM